jgi:hypothetical protein
MNMAIPKILKPLTVTVSFQIEVDLNEVLEGQIVNSTIKEVRRNVGMFLRDKIAENKLTPGEELYLPDNGDIIGSLHEWDLVSYGDL